MFGDSTIHFLKSYQTQIVGRWLELARQELNPDFINSPWFSDASMAALYDQILVAFERRAYRDLNRTIDSVIKHEETPSPLDVKDLLTRFSSAAAEEFELREDSLRDARQIRGELSEMGRSLKQVYSERLCPRLISVLDDHRDDLRERWLRDLPTGRISNHFSILSDEDRESFVDSTFEIYEAVLRGKEQEPAPHPHDPNLHCTRFDSWIIQQVDYFMPKGFDLTVLLQAVEHLPNLLEPILARATLADSWSYRVSQLLLNDARTTMVHDLAHSFVERFSRNFYGEVGIMLHRIKNKLTSVPTTMRTVLAIADEEYEAMFEPMVITMEEAALWAEYDQLVQAAVTAEAPVANGGATDDDLSALKAAHRAVEAFSEEHSTALDTIRMMKLDPVMVETLLEMLGIVFEGGTQTQQLTEDLQLRMNEMYEREPPRREVLSISELLKAATDEAAVDAKARDINFTVDDTAGDLKILGVRRDIARPFVQVIDNAIKYTPEHGEVAVTLGPDGDHHILFSVHDTGIGIPPGEEELVFSLCERCSNAKDFAAGTGTGLYHDRITVMHHNGEMWCESGGLGKGSTFFIRLPVHQEVAEPATGD